MAYDFPNAPLPGQVFQNWTWDSEKWVQTIGAPNQSGVIAIKVFTSSGNYVPSPNMTTCVIECVGGGGGAGGVYGSTTSIQVSGGAGAGGYSRSTFTAAQIGAVTPVTVGAGGTAGGFGGGGPGIAGSTGGNSSVLTCLARGGNGSPAGAVSGLSGGGGATGTGDFTTSGAPGQGVVGSTSALTMVGAGGVGGSSNFGGGGVGGFAYQSTSTGSTAAGYGGGGGGSAAHSTAAGIAGGYGYGGLVVITEYGMTALSASAIAQGAVRFDLPQGLTANQMAQGRANISVTKKNYIINGAMMVSQENGATAGAMSSTYYPVDQFVNGFVGSTGTASILQVASPTPAGAPNRIRIGVTAADATVGAGDIVWLAQRLEGLRVADLRFGSAAAKTVTLQFGVKAPAGTYSVTFINSATNRSYVAEYVVAAGETNADVVKSVTIPGDTTGTWLADNGTGLELRWGLMAGTTWQQAAGAWGTTNAVGSPNQFNFMGTVNNVFELFDVSLTEGSVAPPFQAPDYGSELALCKRYWQKAYVVGEYVAQSAAQYAASPVTFGPEMRAAPTMSVFSVFNTLNAVGATFTNTTTYGTHFQLNSVTAGRTFSYNSVAANARL